MKKIFKIICKSTLIGSTVKEDIGEEFETILYRLAENAEEAVGIAVAEALGSTENIVFFEAHSKFDITITKRRNKYFFTPNPEEKEETRTDSSRNIFTVIEDDYCKAWNNA